MFWFVLLACAAPLAGVAPPRPTLAVAVPLSGPDAALGAAAFDGVALAAGPDVDVLAVDDVLPGAVAHLAALPQVFGVVAHVVRGTAEAEAPAWRATDLPVVVAAPGVFEGLPRVVPRSPRAPGASPASSRRPCGSAPTAPPRAWPPGRPSSAPRARAMDTVDAGQLSHQASKDGAAGRAIAWTGDAAAGGNLLRVLRKTGADVPFLGVGLYDTRFLTAAGAAAEGAQVTSEGRPAGDRAFVDAYIARRGAPPVGPAVDAYEAATLLLAAWRAAGGTPTPAGTPPAPGQPSRASVRAALPTITATGANGPMSLDANLVVTPVVCALFTVSGGALRVDDIASEADPVASAGRGGR